jgi:hypothetical protein
MNYSIDSVLRYCLAGCAVACMATSAIAVTRYVDAPGNKVAPGQYSSISNAMAVLQPGDVLIIAPGVYREGINFPQGDWSTTSSITVIKGGPGGSVVINAADLVTGWTSAGNGVFYHTLPTETAQVTVNGVQLAQIGGTVFAGYPLVATNPYATILSTDGGIWPGRINGDVSSLTIGSFYYDSTARRLYVRTSYADLNSQQVEVSNRSHSLLAQNVNGLHVQNLTFLYGNTSPTGRDGLITITGNHDWLTNVSVQKADSVGIELDGNNNRIASSNANYCGQLGMKARGREMTMVNNVTNYNNTRGFNKNWEAGGVKFTGNGGLSNSTITGHTAIGNKGSGIWFDWGNTNNLIESNVSEYNTGFGIQYEASSGAQIIQNRTIGNSQRGIYLPSASLSMVRNNLVAGNGLEGIAVIDEGGTDPTGVVNMRPVGNTIVKNLIAWNGYALTVPGNEPIFVDQNTYVGQGIQLRLGNGWSQPFDAFVEWQQQIKLDTHSTQVLLPIDPLFASSVRAQQTSPNLAWVQRLPATPATALPVAAAAMLVTRYTQQTRGSRGRFHTMSPSPTGDTLTGQAAQ